MSIYFPNVISSDELPARLSPQWLPGVLCAARFQRRVAAVSLVSRNTRLRVCYVLQESSGRQLSLRELPVMVLRSEITQQAGVRMMPPPCRTISSTPALVDGLVTFRWVD